MLYPLSLTFSPLLKFSTMSGEPRPAVLDHSILHVPTQNRSKIVLFALAATR